MKKSFLLVMSLALLVLASCTKDKEPTIKFITTGNYTNSETTLYVGDKAIFGVDAVSDAVTGNGISKITVTYSNGEEGENFTFNNEDSPSKSWTKTFNTAGNVTITATAYDANGKTASVSMTVKVVDMVKPTINFVNDPLYVSDAAPLYTEKEYTFAVSAEKNTKSNAPITKINVEYSNEDGITEIFNDATGVDNVTKEWTKTFAQTGAIKVTATAIDANGEEASATITVLVSPIPGPDDNPFLGAYECNDLVATGEAIVNDLPFIGSIDEVINVHLTYGSLTITAGSTYNDVKVTMLIEGDTYELNATTDENTIIFDQTPIVIPMQTGYGPVNLHIAVNGTGILEDGETPVIHYNGVLLENGTVEFSGAEFPGTVQDGAMQGDFIKLAAK